MDLQEQLISFRAGKTGENVTIPMHSELHAYLPSGSHPVIANNTIVQNNIGIREDGRFSANHLYANNILIGNSVGFQVDFPAGTQLTWTHNLVFGNTTNYSGIANQTGLNGNISKDPMFLPTRSLGDFELQAGSPAIDAGTLSVPGLPPTDFVGNPGVVDDDCDGSPLPDIGAYEFQPNCIQPNSRVADRLDLVAPPMK